MKSCSYSSGAYKLLAILVYGQVDGTERATPYLFSYNILVDKMLGLAIILTIRVFGTCIECFLRFLINNYPARLEPLD
jgi:hypothetical protein